jgi:hypothetical protein
MYLRSKSEINFEAAKLLQDKGFYASSVHCSYYGVFQLMKFKIKDFFGIDYHDLTSSIRADKRRNTHKYIIDFYKKEIKDNINLYESQCFYRKINDLKKFREQSDYENVNILVEESGNADKIANELRKYITKNFVTNQS